MYKHNGEIITLSYGKCFRLSPGGSPVPGYFFSVGLKGEPELEVWLEKTPFSLSSSFSSNVISDSSRPMAAPLRGTDVRQ